MIEHVTAFRHSSRWTCRRHVPTDFAMPIARQLRRAYIVIAFIMVSGCIDSNLPSGLVVTPSALNFGTATTGGCLTKSITITNLFNSPVTLRWTLSSTVFSMPDSLLLANPIPNSTEVSVRVQFCPSIRTAYVDTLVFSDTLSKKQLARIPLSGSGF